MCLTIGSLASRGQGDELALAGDPRGVLWPLFLHTHGAVLNLAAVARWGRAAVLTRRTIWPSAVLLHSNHLLLLWRSLLWAVRLVLRFTALIRHLVRLNHPTLLLVLHRRPALLLRHQWLLHHHWL